MKKKKKKKKKKKEYIEFFFIVGLIACLLNINFIEDEVGE